MEEDNPPLSGLLASAVVKVARDKLVTALLRLGVGDAAAAMPEDDDEKLSLRRHMEELKQSMEAVAEVVGNAERSSVVLRWDDDDEDAVRVREWLLRLEDAAYGIWDMVDELQANKWKPVTTEVQRPCCGLPVAIATARKGMSIASRTQGAKENLDDLLRLQDGLGNSLAFRRGRGIIDQSASADDAYYSYPTDKFEEDYIVGRDQEKLEIMDRILSAARDSSSSRGLFIVAIVGDGGIGKTTLAKMVFSDASTNAVIRYYARAWVTVGQREFDLKKIGNCILSQLTKGEHHQDYYSSDLQLIAKRLDELLLRCAGGGGNNKQLLLVLDDLWCSDDDRSAVEGLRRMLLGGAGKEDRKVIVMVTTRNKSVAMALGAGIIHRMKPLNEVDSWHLLNRKLGFPTRPPDNDDDRWSSPEEFQQLLQDYGDHPLAIHAIGSTLRSKSTQEIITWVLNTRMWKFYNMSVFALLLLSYQCMPPNLRLCFAYCAIFPRGHSILKEDLIHHWTALQLMEPSDTLSTTQLATRYIGKLLDMAFLQRSITPFPSDAVFFTLHDLVHELAVHVSSGNLIVLDGTNNYQRLRSGKKISYRQAWVNNSDISPANLSYTLSAQLAVLHFYGCNDKQISDDSFSSAKYLRVLELRDCRLQKLPDSIFQLKQLRYLNLSGSTRLVNLPDAFSNLINLGYINLSGCIGLKSLPGSFGLLEKLEHLDLSSCSCLEEIPSVVDGLTNLQHLNLSHPCCYAGEHRFHLRRLKDVWVKLTNLRYLNLSMCLNPIFCYLPEERVEYIESISCLHTLEHLDLSHNIFLSDLPESLGQLSQLQTLNLSGCTRLKRIEKWMGERNFPKKSLVVRNCLGLETYQFVVRTDGGVNSSNLAQLKDVSCKELEISCLEKVISTEEAQSIGLTDKKKLQKLTLVWSMAHDSASFRNHEALLTELVPPQNLNCFELHGYSSEHLPAWLTSRLSSHLPNLVEVSMVDIPNCGNLPPFGVLPSLKRLILRRVAKVTRIDAGCLGGGSKAALHRLLHVTLDGMENLEEFSNCSSNDEPVKFPTLDELVINACPKLRFGDSPPKAQMLVISDCDHLMVSSVKREYVAVEDPSSSTSTATTCASVTEVVIESCKVPLDELKWSLLQGLAPLYSLHIRNCSEKITSPEIMKDHLSSLKLLCFSHCDSMTNLPEYVVQDTSLQELLIHGCRGIKSLPQSICEEKKKHYPHGQPSTSESGEEKKHYPLLRISGCPELKQWCELEENKIKLAHIQMIFEESGTSEQDNRSQETSD